MKKADLLNLVRDELELGTKKGAQDFLDNIEKVFEAVAEKLEAGEGKCKVCKYFTLEKKFFEGKVGKCNGKEYTIDPHEEVLLKKTNALRQILK